MTRFRIFGILISIAIAGFSIWLVAAAGSWGSFSQSASGLAIIFVIAMFVISVWLLIVSIVADTKDIERVLLAFTVGDALALFIVLPVFLFQVTAKILGFRPAKPKKTK